MRGVKVENIKVDNVNIIDKLTQEEYIELYNSSYSIQYVRGLFAGAIYEDPDSTISNIYLSNSTIETASAIVGGIAGYGGISLNNTYIENIKIVSSSVINSSSIPSRSTTGGVFTNLTYNRYKFDNLNINNLTIEANGSHVGGICGLSLNYSPGSIITNSTIQNINIKHKNKVDVQTYYSSNCEPCVGGISAVGTINLENTKISEIHIEIDEGINEKVHAGIIFGSDNCGDLKINQVEISNSTINNNVPNSESGAIGGNGYAKIEIKESKLDNITINSKDKAGGIVGNAYAGTASIENTEIDELEITNAEYAGGLYGHTDYRYTLEIGEGVEIKNSNISGNKSVGGAVGVLGREATIENVKISNTNITSKQMAGGVAGLALGKISGAQVIDCTVTTLSEGEANESGVYENYIGGIAGFSNNRIENCTVLKSTIEAQGENAYAAGGILGHGNDIDDEEQTGEYITYVGNCSVTDSTIKGKKSVGEIIGAIVLILEGNTYTNCTVEREPVTEITQTESSSEGQTETTQEETVNNSEGSTAESVETTDSSTTESSSEGQTETSATENDSIGLADSNTTESDVAEQTEVNDADVTTDGSETNQ